MSAPDAGEAAEILDLLDRDLAGALSLPERRQLYGLLAGRSDAAGLIARALAFATAVADLKQTYDATPPPPGLEDRLRSIPDRAAAFPEAGADSFPPSPEGADEAS